MPSPSRDAGVRFERGKLHVSTSERVAVVRGWPRADALQREHRRLSWTLFEPQFALVRPYRPRRMRTAARRPDSDQLSFDLDVPLVSAPRRTPPQPTPAQLRERAFDAFRFSMPRPVAAVLEPVRYQQWLLLRLLTTGSEALELAQSNSALAFCVAARCRGREIDTPSAVEALRKIAGRKRRDLAGWLGFPATAGVARTLARVEPASLSIAAMVALRNSLAQPEVAKQLGHVPRLNAGVLTIADDPRLLAAATPSLLVEVSEVRRERYHSFTADLLGDTLDMIDIIRPRRAPRRFDSLSRLREQHDRLAVEWCRQQRGNIEACRFPRPPVPGTASIVPIRTPSELIEEGEKQHHCVATYAARVQARSTYIYRVMRPQRATLSIVPGPGGTWRRGNLLAAHNGPVGRETKAAVDRWLWENSI